jgi:ATP-dependent DNA helicase RecG
MKKSQIPIAFDGRYYKRVENTTRVMNFDELKQFFQRDLRFERLNDRDFSFEEFDSETVHKKT